MKVSGPLPPPMPLRAFRVQQRYNPWHVVLMNTATAPGTCHSSRNIVEFGLFGVFWECH